MSQFSVSSKFFIIFTFSIMLFISCNAFRDIEKPNFILISLDTLRADAVPVYGNSESKTPGLNMSAALGTVFLKAWSNSAWTLPAHVSLFSGLLPGQHAVTEENYAISDDLGWLPEVMRKAGYRTAGFTGGGFLSGKYGMDRGFTVYEDHHKEAREAFSRAAEWMMQENPEPYFLFIHTYEIHDYFMRKPGYLKRLRTKYDGEYSPDGSSILEAFGKGGKDFSEEDISYIRSLYQAALEETDKSLEAFLTFLVNSPSYDDTYIILFSDHGEAFGDHQHFHHGVSLYEEMVRIPLIAIGPDYPAGMINCESISLKNVVKLMRERSSIEPLEKFDEKIRAGRTNNENKPDKGAVIAQEPKHENFMIVQGNRKLMLNLSPLLKGRRDFWESFDMALDPAETGRVHVPEVEFQMKKSILRDFFNMMSGSLVIRVQHNMDQEGYGAVLTDFEPFSFRKWNIENEDTLESEEEGRISCLFINHSGVELIDHDSLSMKTGNDMLALSIKLQKQSAKTLEKRIFIGPGQKAVGAKRRISSDDLKLDPNQPPDWDFKRSGVFLFYVIDSGEDFSGAVPAVLDEGKLQELQALGYVVDSTSADQEVIDTLPAKSGNGRSVEIYIEPLGSRRTPPRRVFIN